MTGLDFLNALKEYITENVAKDISLLKENTENEYVHPNVALMALPHKNFVPVDFTVPFILIGFTEGSDEGSENRIAIRIMCATYCSGAYEGDVNLPNESGYIDLLVLLERIKLRLVEGHVIKKMGTIERPINYGVYNEQITYPYNYGYLEFKAQIPLNEFPMNDFF